MLHLGRYLKKIYIYQQVQMSRRTCRVLESSWGTPKNTHARAAW